MARTLLVATDALVEIVDFLPWPGPAARPSGRIVRLVTALRGPATVDVEVAPGADFGPARDSSAWSEGLAFDHTVVRTGVPMWAVPAGRDPLSGHAVERWRGRLHLDAGESAVITVDREGPEAIRPLSVDGARREVERTAEAWRSWLGPATIDGPYAETIARSLLALRSLTWSGAPVGAGTMSLPRVPGGERQSDGRLIRVRDAAAAAVTFRRVGLDEDAEAAETWLRGALMSDEGPGSGDRDLPAVFAIDGGPPRQAEELGLTGWRHSQPVAIGAPVDRLDLDLPGDVWAAVQAAPHRGASSGPGGRIAGPLTGAWGVLQNWADRLSERWSEPDVGLWGSGATGAPLGDGPPPRRLVASRVQIWRALDRATRLARSADPLDLSAIPWQQGSVQILKWLESAAASDGSLAGMGERPDDEPGARRDLSPTDWPDAALLRLAWSGPWPTEHPVVVRTVERVVDQLSTGVLVYRYPAELDDGSAGADRPDVLASVWAVRALAALGRWEEANERMEGIVGLAAPGGAVGLGLLSEAADPVSGELLGNLPTTAVHLALIDAALDLADGP